MYVRNILKKSVLFCPVYMQVFILLRNYYRFKEKSAVSYWFLASKDIVVVCSSETVSSSSIRWLWSKNLRRDTQAVCNSTRMHQCASHPRNLFHTDWSPSNLELQILACERLSPRISLPLLLRPFRTYLKIKEESMYWNSLYPLHRVHRG